MQRLFTDVGVPIKLKSDMTDSFEGRHTEFQKELKRQSITHTFDESERKNHVWKVDIYIRELKKRWHHKMVTKNNPKSIWCFVIEQKSKMMHFILWGREKLLVYNSLKFISFTYILYCTL